MIYIITKFLMVEFQSYSDPTLITSTVYTSFHECPQIPSQDLPTPTVCLYGRHQNFLFGVHADNSCMQSIFIDANIT